jgi:membrane-associated phospholipid phosphatase
MPQSICIPSCLRALNICQHGRYIGLCLLFAPHGHYMTSYRARYPISHFFLSRWILNIWAALACLLCIMPSLYFGIPTCGQLQSSTFFAMFGWIYAALVANSRVHLGYHSVGQVVVGSSLGLMTGFLWHAITHAIFMPRIFPLIEDSRVCLYFHVKVGGFLLSKTLF